MELVLSQLRIPPDQCLAPSAPDAACDLPCEVVEVQARMRGFYVAGFRHFYVDSAGYVTLIRGPSGAVLERVDDLPGGAELDRDAPADELLWRLSQIRELELRGRP